MNFNLIKILFCYIIQDSNISCELIKKKKVSHAQVSINIYIYIYIYISLQIVSILLKKI